MTDKAKLAAEKELWVLLSGWLLRHQSGLPRGARFALSLSPEDCVGLDSNFYLAVDGLKIEAEISPLVDALSTVRSVLA